MIVVGIIFLVVGLILFLKQRSERQTLFDIKSARSMTAAELLETAGAVAAEIGGGSWRDYVKVWGKVAAETPLYSEHKKQPCVYFKTEVIRNYEVRDKAGELEQKSERISQNRQRMPFWLRDRTGNVRINPEGAAIETIEVMDEFHERRSGATLGYRYVESLLPVGREVLVVGAVSDLTGDVVIGQPIKAEHKFIISLKNEDMLAATTSRNAKTMAYGMVICYALGSVFIILGMW